MYTAEVIAIKLSLLTVKENNLTDLLGTLQTIRAQDINSTISETKSAQ
jgi:hypothetical protein